MQYSTAALRLACLVAIPFSVSIASGVSLIVNDFIGYSLNPSARSTFRLIMASFLVRVLRLVSGILSAPSPLAIALHADFEKILQNHVLPVFSAVQLSSRTRTKISRSQILTDTFLPYSAARV